MQELLRTNGNDSSHEVRYVEIPESRMRRMCLVMKLDKSKRRSEESGVKFAGAQEETKHTNIKVNFNGDQSNK